MMDSHTGKTKRQTIPRTIITMISALAHPFEALDAMVSGIKMSAKAALNKIMPPISKSFHKVLMIEIGPNPFRGDGTVRPALCAFLLLKNRDSANGKKTAGKIIHQSPYPHLQVVVFKVLSPIGAPIHTVTMNGSCGRVENKARLARSVVSATKICWRI